MLDFFHVIDLDINPDAVSIFAASGLEFTPWKNALIPQLASTAFAYVLYLSITELLIPSLKKLAIQGKTRRFRTALMPLLILFAISLVYSVAVGVMTWFARPYLFNYANYQLLGMLGYNDKPLEILFFGFGRALGIILFFTGLGLIREYVIALIEAPGGRREYRVMICNNITPLLFCGFLALVILNPLHREFIDYLAWGLPVLALYVYETFSLFPLKEGRQWKDPFIMSRLLAAVSVCSLFSAFIFTGRHWLLELFTYWLFLMLIVTPIVWLFYQQRRDKILQLKGMETALSRSRTDLQFLKSQINPHFLFNTLNTLYGTALKEKSFATAEGIQMLGDMMRFMLHENHLDLVSASKEINYLRNYIALQKLRLPDDAEIQISENIAAEDCHQQIAPMLLIPLVENAFKHGISLAKPSWIKIDLSCDTGKIVLTVSNSIHHRNTIQDEDSGIGLKNLSDRLALLYPERHELRLENRNQIFSAMLTIQ